MTTAWQLPLDTNEAVGVRCSSGICQTRPPWRYRFSIAKFRCHSTGPGDVPRASAVQPSPVPLSRDARRGTRRPLPRRHRPSWFPYRASRRWGAAAKSWLRARGLVRSSLVRGRPACGVWSKVAGGTRTSSARRPMPRIWKEWWAVSVVMSPSGAGVQWSRLAEANVAGHVQFTWILRT
jgi:hypothetical protein